MDQESGTIALAYCVCHGVGDTYNKKWGYLLASCIIKVLLDSSDHRMLMIVALFTHILGYESEGKSLKGLGADDLAAVFFLSG